MKKRTSAISRRDLADGLRPRLLRVSQALRRETATTTVTTSQSAVLNLLLLGNPLRVSDLAKAEAVTLPTMTQIVNRMVEAGWVKRTAPMGTYNNTIDITNAGRKVALEIAEIRNGLLERRLEKLTDEECAHLGQMIELIDKMFEQRPWLSKKTPSGSDKPDDGYK